MRLLHINNVYRPLGGSELYLYAICRLLRESGIASSIVHGDADARHDPEAMTAAYHVEGLDAFRAQPTARLARSLEMAFERERPDLICVHNIHNPQVTEIATRLGPVLKFVHDHELYCPKATRMIGPALCTNDRPLICVANTVFAPRGLPCLGPRRAPWAIVRAARQMFANHRVHRDVQAFQVASRFVKQAMVAFGYDADRIAVNPYFTRVPPEPAEASRDRTVLFVGRLEPAKGLECLLDSLGLLRGEFRATVVGQGSPDYEARLQQQVRSRGLSGKVEFAGSIDNDRLEAYYRAAAVVVVPSLWPEPFGIVGIEAMAHSRPVVAFDVGGISEWLEDGGTGYLVARGDLRGLAGRIDLLLGDRALRERLGRRGHETAARLFTWERHRERLLAIFPGDAGV